LVKRPIELQNGEGENGYWLEGQLSHRFVLYKGKYYSNQFLQKLRLTFDAGFLIRMTRDSSSPLLPGNNDIGFGADILLTNIKNIERENKPKVWLKTQIHHYSNGQSSRFYSDPAIKRNNYRNGDFSTNYLQAVLQTATKLGSGGLFSLGFGYQYDLPLFGPLVMNQELNNSYGRNKLVANLQFVRPPVEKPIMKDHHEVGVDRRSQLDDFRHTNKYRLGWHNYLYFIPSITNEVGFQLHTYFGRDYLNIRYDDVILTAQLGIIVKIAYRSPFSN
jgi:hypothetical protein